MSDLNTDKTINYIYNTFTKSKVNERGYLTTKCYVFMYLKVYKIHSLFTESFGSDIHLHQLNSLHCIY